MPPRSSFATLDLVRAEAGAAIRLALLLGLGATLLTFAALWLKLAIFQWVVPTGSIETAIGLGLGFVLIVVLLVTLDHLRDLALLAAGNRLARRLSGPAVLALATRAGQPAAASAALLGDIDEVRRGIAGTLCAAILEAVLVPAGLLVLWLVHPWFAGIAALGCAVAAGASLLAQRHARRALAESNGVAVHTAELVADATRCAEAVEAMGMRPALARRWLVGLNAGSQALGRAQETGRRLGGVVSAVQGLASGAAMLIGAWLTLGGENLGVGLMAGMLLTARVIDPFARLGGSMQDWGKASAAWARLSATLVREAAPAPAAGFRCAEGRLSLEKLTFLHPGTPRPLLRELDLAVGPGEVVAIAGAPGSGKTTLLRLMLGMERPTAGGAFLDGHAVSQWDRAALAEEIGYLPQDSVLGEGSIAEAIARMAIKPDMEAVLAAAQMAGAHDTIVGLRLGYATPASGLSMGQRQRVALARAVYGQPRLVLLDEPTAWLDAAGGAAVAGAIARLRAARVAVVLSAHRPALLAAADRMLVLSGGTLHPAATPEAKGNVVHFNQKGAA